MAAGKKTDGQTMTIKLIHDADHGGDDFIATLMILGNPDLFELLAITSNCGNVPLDLAAANALRCLEMGGRTDIPVYKGAASPYKSAPKGGDDAHGSDGLGGATLPAAAAKPRAENAIDYLIETLERAETPVTLAVTGPMTNAALLLERAPHLKPRIAQIVAMGGGIGIEGNITKFAEFNFYMDPEAADYVLKAGVPVVLHTLGTTHQLLFGPSRHPLVENIVPHVKTLSRIMRSAEHLDIANFGEGAYIHDENTIAYLKNPGWYETKRVRLSVNTNEASEAHGNLRVVAEDPASPVELVTRLADSDAVFAFIADSVRRAVA